MPDHFHDFDDSLSRHDAQTTTHNQAADDNRRARGCRRRCRGVDAHTRLSLDAGAASAGRTAAVGIVAAPVQSHDVPIYLRGVGTVIAYNNVLVRSQITGQLVKISFHQGQQVKKGDVLAA